MSKLKLSYFDFHGGRGEPARLALSIGEIPFASPTLSEAARRSLAVDIVSRLQGLRDDHRVNLAKHRSRHGF